MPKDQDQRKVDRLIMSAWPLMMLVMLLFVGAFIGLYAWESFERMDAH